MKAAVYYENGAPDVFRYENVPDPECHPRGIVIRVEAVSIEGGDTLNRLRGALVTKPHVVGYQVAGEVVEVGSEVTNLKVGDKAVTTGAYGSHAELRAVSARAAWKIPAGMDLKLAACVPIPFGTAHECLFEFGRMKKGEVVLVQAGASGVGIAAIQLAARAGASMVLATASSDARLEKLQPLGLTHGINPPSLKESGVTLRTPMSQGGPWPAMVPISGWLVMPNLSGCSRDAPGAGI